jgi:hypothetical protein
VFASGAKAACFRQWTLGVQAYRHQKIFLAAERSRGNQKTPERMTIEKPLYFCSRQFVGQFVCVMKLAVRSSAASGCSCLFPVQHHRTRVSSMTRDMAQLEPSSLEQYRAGRSTD